MIRCVAIDDEPGALSIIQNHASRVDFLTLEQTFLDPFKAMTYLNDQAVDLLFLDINMPDISGFGLLKNLNPKPLVIFTTAHSEYAIQSYEVEAVDYLLKPFDFARFFMAVSKVKERLSDSRDFFFVNTGNQKQRIVFQELQYVSGEGNYVRYITPSNRFLVRASIRETLQLLPSAMFLQIHRSHIISLQWIDKIEDNHVYIGGVKIPISTSFRDGFLKRIGSL